MLHERKSPKFIDLFAGCGGLSLGLMQAGWTGLFAIEKSDMAFDTLKFNLINRNDKYSYDWPEWLPQEPLDIQTAINQYKDNLLQLEGIDLLAGGPPCQGFSLAGRRNVNDSRNKLIEYYLEFVKLVQPRIIFLENVRTFATSFTKTEKGDKGLPVLENQFNADAYIQQQLAPKYKIFIRNPVKAKDYGVPQTRPRYILIAIRKDLINEYQPSIDPFDLLDTLRTTFLASRGLSIQLTPLQDAISDLKKAHGTVDCPEPGMKKFRQGRYGAIESRYQNLMRKPRNENSGLLDNLPDSHRFSNHRKDTLNRFKNIIENYIPGKQLTREELNNLGLQKNRVALLSKIDVCHTLTSSPDDLVHYDEPRVLTVREYARIQSFPDWFKFKSTYTSGGLRRRNDVPRYTQVANAVPPLLAEILGIALIKINNVLDSKQPLPITLGLD